MLQEEQEKYGKGPAISEKSKKLLEKREKRKDEPPATDQSKENRKLKDSTSMSRLQH